MDMNNNESISAVKWGKVGEINTIWVRVSFGEKCTVYFLDKNVLKCVKFREHPVYTAGAGDRTSTLHLWGRAT
jgi:hypothetical protein